MDRLLQSKNFSVKSEQVTQRPLPARKAVNNVLTVVITGSPNVSFLTAAEHLRLDVFLGIIHFIFHILEV